jgi:hypothetical protein
MEAEDSVPNPQELSTCPYPEPVHITPSHLYKIHPTLALAFLVASFRLAFPPTFLFSPFGLHAPPISSSSTSLF